jgi:hypothetical protein
MSDDTICGKDAAYRYTWPGRDESFICEEHSAKLRAVADAMGLHLQLVTVEPEGEPCRQRVRR